MGLKASVKTLEELPEQLRSLYVKSGEEFILDTDEPSIKELRGKLDEFRNNNRTLFKEKEDLTARMEKLKDIDPVKYQEAMTALATIEQLEDSQLIKGGKYDELKRKWTGSIATEWENKVKAESLKAKDFETKYNATEKEFHEMLLENQIVQAITEKVGQPKQGALGFIIDAGKKAFKIDPKERKAVTEVSNEKGEIHTLETWGKQLLQSNPYLFEGGTGGGATGGKEKRQQGGVRLIANDPIEMGKNLADIASGKAEVQG